MGGIRGRDFRLLGLSSALSALGDELALIALTIKVAELTDSGPAVGALLLAGLLPLVIFAPAAGVLVDNFETTRSLGISSALQAVLAVGLAFATGLPSILMLAFLLGTCTAVANPSVYTLVPVVVGDDQATAANAYLESARYVGMIAGPLLAGTLAAGVGTRAALLVDAGTFFVIALAAAAMRTRRRPQEAEEAGGGEARAGFGVIRRDRVLLVTFSVFAAVILFAAMDNVAEVFFARRNLNAGAWGYGLLASAWLLGMVGGASLIARTLPNDRLVPAVMTGALVGGAAVAAAAAVPVLAVAIGMFVVGGVANGVESVSMRSLIVHRVRDRYRGRVFAAYGGVANGMQIGAMALGGGVVAVLGPRAALLLGGAGSAVAGLIGFTAYRLLPAEVRPIRAEDEAPDAQTTDVVPPAVIVPETERFTRIPEVEAVDEEPAELSKPTASHHH